MRPYQRTPKPLLLLSRQEEIAKLEEQLRQLREEQDGDTACAGVAGNDGKQKSESESSRRLEKIQGKDMLLSERELILDGLVAEDEESSNGRGGSFVTVVGAIVATVALLAFSQVPVGQESLARYLATGSSAVRTIDLGDINPDRASNSLQRFDTAGIVKR